MNSEILARMDKNPEEHKHPSAISNLLNGRAENSAI
jgi:hypothetical protein